MRENLFVRLMIIFKIDNSQYVHNNFRKLPDFKRLIIFELTRYL